MFGYEQAGHKPDCVKEGPEENRVGRQAVHEEECFFHKSFFVFYLKWEHLNSAFEYSMAKAERGAIQR